MKLLRTIADVRQHLEPLRGRSRIGFVPTMGALHEGHVRCFDAARSRSECVVASIFVNPTQFNDSTDLAAYPRREHEDAAIAAKAGVDIIFVPAAEEIYPAGFATFVDVQGAAAGLEGVHRPGHFRGVATVCVKLFAVVQPTEAFFGQKDAQQVAVMEQVVRDLNLDLSIQVVPTVRDGDGLALSSRNARLSPDERRRALAIPRALAVGLESYQRGLDPVAAAAPVLHDLDVEYLAVRSFGSGPVLLVAAQVGQARLIDNVPLDDPGRAGMSGVPLTGVPR